MHELATESHGTFLAPPRLRLVARDVRARVLLADDDPDLRGLLSLTLRRAGYDVVEAADGVELLDRIEATIAKRDYFAVIVADVHMPGLTGLDVLAALRCTSWTTPVILITAFGDPATKAEADDLGATVLEKPLDLDGLRTAVRAAVER
jgi:DNA-binding response OmpR family regulator